MPTRRRNVIDVFNGDADGLLARHQYRLAYPVALQQTTLVSGVKRDIALLDRVLATQALQRNDEIQVFDLSFDKNASAARSILDAGARIIYFDHHGASLLQPHPRLSAHIDDAADVCTSLLVDRHCLGAHRPWAIAAAFGDNLSAVGRQLSQEAGLSPGQENQLRLLGECLNYNAYGESVEDLHYPPVTLAARLQPYADPFDFIAHEDVLPTLKAGYEEDLAKALAVEALHATEMAAVYLLPDRDWARRVSGAFANHLVHACPSRAHAILTTDAHGTATVSIRAPQSAPRDADRVAIRFTGGGGRALAAGIESFSLDRLPGLIAVMQEIYAG